MGKRGRKATKKSRIVFQERHGYHCHACGTCCRRWTIYLDDAEEMRLVAVDWGSLSTRLVDVQVIEQVVPPGESTARPALARQEDGSCIFLEEDGLCMVHRHRGFDEKPLPCRIFPFRMIGTPDGAVAGCSFYCPAVYRNETRPFEGEALLREAIVSGRLPRSVNREVQIRDDWKVPWSLYRKLEKALDAILADEGCSLPVRMLAMHFLVSRHLNLFGRDFLDEKFPYQSMQEDALKMAGNQAGSFFFERFFRVPFLLFPESLKLLGVKLTAGDKFRYLRLLPQFMIRAGAPATLTFPGGVPLRKLENVELDSERFDEPLTRFFRHVVFRKDLLARNNVIQVTEILLLAWTLVRWYARAHACLAGRDAVEGDDVREAVADVERLFLFHSSALTAPFEYEFFRILLDFLFANNAFSASMAGVW